MLDLAAYRALEFGLRDFLNLDFSGPDVDDAVILAHEKSSLYCIGNDYQAFWRSTEYPGWGR
jgi:hypothetical protein